MFLLGAAACLLAGCLWAAASAAAAEKAASMRGQALLMISYINTHFSETALFLPAARRALGGRALMLELPDEIWARVALCAGACASVSLLRRSLAARRLCRRRAPRYLWAWFGHSLDNARALTPLSYLAELASCFDAMAHGSARHAYLLPTRWHARHFSCFGAAYPNPYTRSLKRSQVYRALNLYAPQALRVLRRCHTIYRLTQYEVRWARRHCPGALALIY